MSYVNSGGHLTFTSSTIVSKSPFGCNTVMSFMVTIVLIPAHYFYMVGPQDVLADGK